MASLGFGSLSFFRNSRRNRPVQLTKAPRRHPISLGFEALEPRQMLAADMAEIVGTVRLDAQGDGNPANDTVVAGASVALWRDGGNGTFDGGAGDDVSALAPTITDAQGKYRFSGLGAGKYFVKAALPSSMQTQPGGDVREVVISALDSEGAMGVTIDEFTSMQKVEAEPPLPASHPSTLIDPTVLGNERDMYVELTAGTDIFSSVSLVSGGGLLRLASDTTVTGNAKIVWDGADGSATSVNPTGLGGVDFSSFNGNRMTGLRLAVGADHANSVVKLRIYSDAGRWTEFQTVVPETPGGAATSQVVFNFDGSASNSAGGGADFSEVGAIELTFQGVSAVDGQVSVVDIVGFTTKTADFTAQPRLSLGDRVWNDGNNNGQLDPGELGIAGVKVNLYFDTNNNGQYTPGVDQFVDTETTDGTGRYLFANLLAGNYIVQVDAANFGAAQPLAGLASSIGAAADPDNNVDNDDNGTALAGAGVVSQAVTLSGLSEPTSDGDDANSNRTVDFGFYGFDLVLTKATNKGTVSPTELLTYTVTVTNDGPSTSFNVKFTDELPAGVTFKSMTVPKPGHTLVHSNGKITGGLGNMADGEVIVISVVVEVNASALGVLVNHAEVIGDNEINLDNNEDDVENPVEPKIDLQIDKSDNPDPVKQNQLLTYSIKGKNNGPSNATEVQIVDVLPPQVTFVSATRPSASTTPGTMIFDVGNLAAGAEVQFTVTVRVNAGVTGTFINHVEISGKEVEITYANNEDDEPTTVQIDPATIEGNVYVDKDNDGVVDAGERPIPNVTLTLTGTDFTGASVTRTTKTNLAGHYKFEGLQPGQYNVKETHPAGYKDGKDTVGNTFDDVGGLTIATAFLEIDTNAEDLFDADAISNLRVNGGYAAKDFNFGEQAVTITKRNFVQRVQRMS